MTDKTESRFPSNERLKRLIEKRMKELGIESYRELERKAGIPYDGIRNFMAGRSKSIHPSRAEAIAGVLKIPMTEIVSYRKRPIDKSLEGAAIITARDGLKTGADGGPLAPTICTLGINGEFVGLNLDTETDFFAEVHDDAMAPAVSRGDWVLIRRGKVQTEPHRIYLLALPSGTNVIRRINQRVSDGKFDILPDNQAYQQERGIDADKVNVIGSIQAICKRT